MSDRASIDRASVWPARNIDQQLRAEIAKKRALEAENPDQRRRSSSKGGNRCRQSPERLTSAGDESRASAAGSNVRNRRSIWGRAARHSATTRSSLASPGARFTITTKSTPAGQSSRVARNASRTRRLARLRTTEFPIRREAVTPRRGEPSAEFADRIRTKPGVDTR